MARNHLFFQNYVCLPFYLRKCDFNPLEWALGDVISARLSAQESSSCERHLFLKRGNTAILAPILEVLQAWLCVTFWGLTVTCNKRTLQIFSCIEGGLKLHPSMISPRSGCMEPDVFSRSDSCGWAIMGATGIRLSTTWNPNLCFECYSFV